eukprot:EG_transcript_21501
MAGPRLASAQPCYWTPLGTTRPSVESVLPRRPSTSFTGRRAAATQPAMLLLLLLFAIVCGPMPASQPAKLFVSHWRLTPPSLPLPRAPSRLRPDVRVLRSTDPASADNAIAPFAERVDDDADLRWGMMAAKFTCGVCNTSAMKQFRRLSYERGIVIVECPGCLRRHVLADHLGWGLMDKKGNVESLFREEGREVLYGRLVNGSVVLMDGVRLAADPAGTPEPPAQP